LPTRAAQSIFGVTQLVNRSAASISTSHFPPARAVNSAAFMPLNYTGAV
jgi:hypothetical protein